MRVKDLVYPTRSIYKYGKFYDFKDYICENIPDKVALELAQTGQYQVMDDFVDSQTLESQINIKQLLPFNPPSWSQERKLVFDTAIGFDNGYGKAGIMMAEALSKVCDLYILNNGYINSNLTEVSPTIRKVHEKQLDKIDSWYMQFWPAFNFNAIAKRQVGYTMLESTRISQRWVDWIHRSCERVIVPCEAQKQAFIDSGVEIDVKVIPLGIEAKDYKYKKRESSGNFIFGSEGTLTFRKGIDIAVKAFQLAFPKIKYPNVQYFIKTREGRPMPYGAISRKNGDIIVNNDERIVVMAEKWSHAQLIKDFYDLADCYLFPSRGEGFGMTTVQAMACGLPVIGTDCSGIQDHLNNEHGYLVPTKLVDMPNGYVWDKEIPGIRKARDNAEYAMLGVGYPLDDGKTHLQAPGQQWWECEVEDLAKIMLHVYNNQQEAFDKGKKAAKYVRDNLTSRHTALHIIGYLDQKF